MPISTEPAFVARLGEVAQTSVCDAGGITSNFEAISTHNHRLKTVPLDTSNFEAISIDNHRLKSVPLFVPQRHERIDFRRASRRQPAGCKDHQSQ
jgi:hypothetical protein